MSDWNGKNSGLVPDRMKQAAEIIAEAVIYFSQATGGESDDCGVYFSELCKYIGGDAGFFERFISVFSEADGAAVPNGVPRLDGAGKIAALFGQVMSVAGKTPNQAGDVPLCGTDLQSSETDARSVAESLSTLNSDKTDKYETNVLESKPLAYAGAGDFCALIRFGANVPTVNASLQFDGNAGGLVFTSTGNVSYTDPEGNQYPSL